MHQYWGEETIKPSHIKNSSNNSTEQHNFGSATVFTVKGGNKDY